MPQLKPQIGEIYRHFKGNLYQVTGLATHSETGESMVVYQALYGDFATFVRPYELFIGEVDFGKYPECTDRFRFTLVPRESLQGDRKDTSALVVENAVSRTAIGENDKQFRGVSPYIHGQSSRVAIGQDGRQGTENWQTEDVVSRSVTERNLTERHTNEKETTTDDMRLISPTPIRQQTTEELIITFLDERDFKEKDKILSEIGTRPELNDGLIDNLAAAIDVVIDEGPLEKRFASLRTCVQTRARYENTRLRG